LSGVLGAAAARAAGDDTADRAELHCPQRLSEATFVTLVTIDCTRSDIAMSVSAAAGEVYSPPVLRLQDQPRDRFARIVTI
jgi:hypothetical protein